MTVSAGKYSSCDLNPIWHRTQSARIRSGRRECEGREIRGHDKRESGEHKKQQDGDLIRDRAVRCGK